MAFSPQQQVNSVSKVAVVEGVDCSVVSALEVAYTKGRSFEYQFGSSLRQKTRRLSNLRSGDSKQNILKKQNFSQREKNNNS